MTEPTVGFIRYREGRKYQLAQDYQVQTDIFPDEDIVTEYVTLTKHGLLTLKEGYASDGCSPPAVNDHTNLRGGFTHDGLCQLGRLGLLDQKWFHKVSGMLRRVCCEDGMGKFRCWYYFKGVDDLGKSAFAAGNEPYPVLTAP